jgi:hypothetical protein
MVPESGVPRHAAEAFGREAGAVTGGAAEIAGVVPGQLVIDKAPGGLLWQAAAVAGYADDRLRR